MSNKRKMTVMIGVRGRPEMLEDIGVIRRAIPVCAEMSDGQIARFLIESEAACIRASCADTSAEETP